MTEDRDKEAFTRWFLGQITAKAPLHTWREAFIAPHSVAGENVIAAIGLGAVWFGTETTKAICQDVQQHIDALRTLRGENVDDKSC